MKSLIRRASPVATLLACALPLAATPTSGQPTYKCTRDNSVYYSDRACEIDSKPVVNAGRVLRPEAPPHWRHLGTLCRQAAERLHRLRLATTAGEADEAASEQLATEQEHYNEICWDDEQRARRRLVELARDEHERQNALRQQAETLVELCTEMRRIRDKRRPGVATMTAGERADFERFETNFTNRCQGALPR